MEAEINGARLTAFQPFLRFYLRTYVLGAKGNVRTVFQPFLRFYAGGKGRLPPDPVSTLLEILPLVLGGFLGV